MKHIIFWHRRDLRLFDNAGLFHALQAGLPVIPIFIFDKNILDKLPKNDLRVVFIHQMIEAMQQKLISLGSSMQVFYGNPKQVFEALLTKYEVEAVYTNADYEPYARQRDADIADVLQQKGVDFCVHKDHVICEKYEVLKDDQKPYTVFTPYKNRWLKTVTDDFFVQYDHEKVQKNYYKSEAVAIPSLTEMGFEAQNVVFAEPEINEKIIELYAQQRDFPAIKGTTRLSMHLRFGTVSVRQLAVVAKRLSETWLNELIWRDFYAMIIYHFPHSAQAAFRPAYDKIPWRDAPQDFALWCAGKTGYPLVDAGMRELNATGFMHNRVRMVVASFLTKHLLLDWRLGEAYFAQKLLDFELASNVGGWQWAAGSGCDAAPYFRVFNPMEQAKKFDAKGEYVRKWVPEIDGFGYVAPMVEHSFARNRAIDTYKKELSAG